MIQLRGHHLLCMLTYVGRGYTPAFVARFDAIAAQLSRGGAALRIVAGVDDLCASLQQGSGCSHAGTCHLERVAQRDAAALTAVSDWLGLPSGLAPGDSLRLTRAMADRLREGFAAGTIRVACAGCQWHGFCSDIAAKGFGGVKLFPA